MLCARTGSSWFFPLVENLNRLLRSGSGSRPLARPLQASPRVVGLLLRTGCALLINISAVPTRLPIPTWGNRVPPAFCSRCWHLHPLLSSRFTPCHQRPGVVQDGWDGRAGRYSCCGHPDSGQQVGGPPWLASPVLLRVCFPRRRPSHPSRQVVNDPEGSARSLGPIA